MGDRSEHLVSRQQGLLFEGNGYPEGLPYPEASKGEGGGRISPDLGSAALASPKEEPLLPQQLGSGPDSSAAPHVNAPSGALQGSAVQQTRTTKRTPIPSVRLQRMMEGEASPPSHKRSQSHRRKAGGTGGKRSASIEEEQPQQQQQQQQQQPQQHAGGSEVRRIKPRLHGSSSSGADGAGYYCPLSSSYASASGLHESEPADLTASQPQLWAHDGSPPAFAGGCIDKGEVGMLHPHMPAMGDVHLGGDMRHTDLMVGTMRVWGAEPCLDRAEQQVFGPCHLLVGTMRV